MSLDVTRELGQNFIEYAAAVNTDRSIPDAKSGLKPVARRILFGMMNTGRYSNKPYVKNARIVGDVMGSLHPHGDSSIYGALVRLSQPWIMRYPLVDFHGNQGSINGDGPAAMRYTEGRLNKLSEMGMLAGLKKNAVEYMPTYDDLDKEPITLPAIFPNLLCNPNSGIGVAMACNWAPHNLREVAAAINQVLNGEEPTLPGPDFPTGGVIINKNDIPKIMATGHGSVKIRGKYEIDKQKIIFTEIPYGTCVEDLIAEIGKVCDDKTIEGINDVKDQTNEKGVKIVITCDKTASPSAIVNKLFAKTNLQTSFSYNQIALVDKIPTELNLKGCIEVYIKHNIECLINELNFDKKAAEDRLHIVLGLLIALEDIDNVIALIKSSKDSANAKENLIKKYGIDDIQAKAILAMRLSTLAKMEKIELEKERDELKATIEDINSILNSEQKQLEIIRKRLSDIVDKFGDARKTELAQIEVPKEEKEIAEVIPEDMVVVMSQNGDIKRIPTKSFKTQKRGGKGTKSEADAIMDTISTNTIDTLMFFSDKGKMYRTVVDNLPIGNNTTKGNHISSLIKMGDDEKIIAMSSLHRKSTPKFVVFVTTKGLIKKTLLSEYTSVKKNTGIQAIKLGEGDTIASVNFMDEEELLVVSHAGMAIRFTTKDINPIGRVSAGVKSIKLSEGDYVVAGLPIHKVTDMLAVITENGMGKKVQLNEFSTQGRNGKGVIVSKDAVAGVAMVDDEDTLLLVGQPTSICFETKELPVLGRAAAGNIVIKNSKVKRVVKF